MSLADALDAETVLATFSERILCRLDEAGRIIAGVEELASALDRPREALSGALLASLVVAEDAAAVTEALACDLPRPVDLRLRRGDGQARAFDAIVKRGSVSLTVCWRREYEAAAERNRVLHGILDALDVGLYVKDRAGRYEMINASGARFVGRPKGEILGASDDQLLPEHVARRIREGEARVISTQTVRRYEETLSADGEQRVFSVSRQPWRDARGQVRGVIGVRRDITETKQAERAQRASEERFRLLTESLDLVFWITSARDGREIIYANPALGRVWGVDGPEHFLAGVHPEDRPALEARLAASPPAAFELEHRVLHPSGELRHVRSRAFAVHDTRGTAVRLAGFSEDITERKQTEQTLVEVEAQLRQSQKMDAIGRLAGGVAHDFNNLLAVITTYSDLALHELSPDDPLHQDIDEIKKAAFKSAALVRQLLAFSRKQDSSPKAVDLNEIIADMHKMLRRLIGDEIDLDTRPAPDLGILKADPSHLEQILMNLVVNAGHAIEGAGRILVRTENVNVGVALARKWGVEARAYALLEVEDDGCGMDQATLAQIFEPFFTTKPAGQGTGLGLSTVYGLVKQMQGHIDVESRPGEGSRFRIYIPRAEELSLTTGIPVFAVLDTRGDETVLLVEDEVPLRKLARRVLEGKGYRVLEAETSGDALLLAEAHEGRIDLLLTDVVMPRLSGPKLAERLGVARPDTRVLFMSGFPGAEIPTDGYLAKPFTPDALLDAVRRALDA